MRMKQVIKKAKSQLATSKPTAKTTTGSKPKATVRSTVTKVKNVIGSRR